MTPSQLPSRPADHRPPASANQASQEVRVGCLASPSVLVLAWPSRIGVGGVTSRRSASAAAVSGSGLLRLRTTAVTAPAAAVSAEPPTSLRHRRRGCLAGSIRRAAEDSRAEILGATLSCRTCPARATCGAAQARVVCTLRAAVAPVLLARGLACSAILRVACAPEASVACTPEASVLASCFLLLLRDIATSAGVFRWSTLPPAGNVNHRDRCRGGPLPNASVPACPSSTVARIAAAAQRSTGGSAGL